MRWCLYLVALTLLACRPSAAQTFALPPPPTLSEQGEALILEFETGGQSDYDRRPEWPRGASGITIGIGYDTGYFSRSVILSDWQKLRADYRSRLADNAGIKGERAHARLAALRDIIVEWELATQVFNEVDVAREFSSAQRAIPGFDLLRPNAQAAIISLGFNRGWQMSGPSRVEFRAIRDLVPSRDYEGIAGNLRKMVRIWIGTQIENGMRRRRLAEARLVVTP